MIEHIVFFLKGMSLKWIIAIIAAMPVVELRLAIPYGIAKGMDVQTVFWMAIIGNLMPVLPLLYLLEPASNLLRRIKIFNKFFNWLFERTRKRSEVVQRYELLGLIILVAIPLPMTGAWTGSIAAFLFGLNKKLSFIAITAGVFIAAIVVSLLSVGIKGIL